MDEAQMPCPQVGIEYSAAEGGSPQTVAPVDADGEYVVVRQTVSAAVGCVSGQLEGFLSVGLQTDESAELRCNPYRSVPLFGKGVGMAHLRGGVGRQRSVRTQVADEVETAVVYAHHSALRS